MIARHGHVICIFSSMKLLKSCFLVFNKQILVNSIYYCNTEQGNIECHYENYIIQCRYSVGRNLNLGFICNYVLVFCFLFKLYFPIFFVVRFSHICFYLVISIFMYLVINIQLLIYDYLMACSIQWIHTKL